MDEGTGRMTNPVSAESIRKNIPPLHDNHSKKCQIKVCPEPHELKLPTYVVDGTAFNVDFGLSPNGKRFAVADDGLALTRSTAVRILWPADRGGGTTPKNRRGWQCNRRFRLNRAWNASEQPRAIALEFRAKSRPGFDLLNLPRDPVRPEPDQRRHDEHQGTESEHRRSPV
jgi:hypothetical protein